jgi:hypothetical protein
VDIGSSISFPGKKLTNKAFKVVPRPFQIDRNCYKSLNINTREVSWLRMEMRLLTQLRETACETLPRKYPTQRAGG